MSNLMMLLIIVVIVVPGFFIVNRIAKTLYSDNNQLNAKSKKRYGVQRFEEGLQQVAEKAQEEAASPKDHDHKAAANETASKLEK